MNTTSIIDRKTLSVSTAGLLGKWYMYWVKLGGTKPDQESLCHFMRVLLIWAPLRWFFLAHHKSIKLVSPSSVALVALFDLNLLLAFEPTVQFLFLLAQALMMAAVVLINVGVLIAIFGTILGSSKSKILLAWLKSEGLDPLLNVMEIRVLKVPVRFYTLMALVAVLWFFLPGVRPTIVLIAIGLASITFFAGFLIGLFFLNDKVGEIELPLFRKDKGATTKPPSYAREAVSEFFSLSKGYLKAKKARICPFINIQGLETSPSPQFRGGRTMM